MSIIASRYTCLSSRQDGRFALWWAAYKGRTEVIQQLVKAGANLDLQDKVCQYVEIHNVHEYSE